MKFLMLARHLSVRSQGGAPQDVDAPSFFMMEKRRDRASSHQGYYSLRCWEVDMEPAEVWEKMVTKVRKFLGPIASFIMDDMERSLTPHLSSLCSVLVVKKGGDDDCSGAGVVRDLTAKP